MYTLSTCICVCAAGMNAHSSQLPVSGVFHGTLHSPGTLTAHPGDLALIPPHLHSIQGIVTVCISESQDAARVGTQSIQLRSYPRSD